MDNFSGEHTNVKGCGVDFGMPGLALSDWSSPRRHGRNYNMAFCDGHVSGLDPMVLFDLRKTAVNWNNDHQAHPEAWSAAY